MKVRSRGRVALSLAAVAGLYGIGGTVGYAANTPIALTTSSYNANTIVNAPFTSTGSYSGVDSENGISFWSTGFNSANALPANGVINSSTNSQTTFQLLNNGGSYGTNNTLLINADSKFTTGGVSSVSWAPAYNQSGSVTFSSNASAYSTIALLYTTSIQNGNSSFQMGYTLKFADGTVYNNSGAAAFTAYDWSSTTSSAAGSLGRVWIQGSNIQTTSGTSWTLHEADISIPTAYIQKQLAGISFLDPGTGSYSAGGTNPNAFSLYAVSGSTTTSLLYTGTDPTTPDSWDTTSNNFANGTTPAPFTAGALVTFDDTADNGASTHNVNIPSAVSPFLVTFNNNTSSYTLNGSAITGTAAVTLNGTGSVTFSNANTYTGATLINAGSLILNSGGAIGSTTVNVSSGAMLTLGGTNTQLPAAAVVTDNGTFNLSSAVSTFATLNGSSSSAVVNVDLYSSLTVGSGTFAGSINLAGGSFNKATTGTLLLSGINNFAGNTSVNAGTLTLSHTGSNYTGSSFFVNSGATLDLLVGGANQLAASDITSILSSVNFTSGSVLAIDTTGGNFNLTSGITVPGFSKLGTNTLNLAGANNFTGGSVLLTAGTLQLSNINALSGATVLTLSTGTTLDIATNGGDSPYATGLATGLVGTIISDVAAGSATAVNHPMGAMNLGNGTLNIAGGSAVTSGTPALTFSSLGLTGGSAGTAIVNPTTANVTLGPVSITQNAAAKTLNLAGTSSGNFAGPITNGLANVAVSKTSTSTWTLVGNSNYSGSTTVTSGTLVLTGQINTTNTFAIGNTSGSAGALYQAGASSVFNGTSTSQYQIGSTAGAFGYFNLSGGTATFGSELDTGGSGGGSGTFGRFDMTGGSLNLSINASSAAFLSNRSTTSGETSVINLTGGSVQVVGGTPTDNANNGLIANWGVGTSTITIGSIGASTPSGSFITPTLTVKLNHGTSSSNANGVSGASTVLNLDGGGFLQTLGFLNGPVANNANVFVNFNGGTLKAGSANNTAFLQNIGGAYIYGGGATIDDNGQSISISQPLLAPTLGGVSSVAITTPGVGYIVPPKVTFTGGGGTGATGYSTINPSTGALTGIVITNPGTGYTSAPTVALTANTGFASANAASGFTVSTSTNVPGGLTKIGVGTLSLTGSSTYTGTTNIVAGTLTLDHSGTNLGALASPVSVGGSGTFLVKGNTTIGGLTTTASGASVSLADGTINTLNVSGGITFASGSAVSLEIGATGGSSDLINATGAASVTGSTTINLIGSSISNGNYVLFNAAGGGLTPGGGGFVIGTHPSGRFNSFGFTNSTSTQEILSVSATAFAATDYWTGAASFTAGDAANNWSTGTVSSNFSTNLAGTIDQNQIPGPVTDVVFTAAKVNSSSPTLTTTLDNSFAVKGLFFNVPVVNAPATQITSTVLNLGANTLTLGADGLVLTSASLSSGTIGTGSVSLGSSQAWANNSSSMALTVNSNISSANASGATLTLDGSGAGGVTLSGTISDGAGPLALVFGQTGITTLNGSNTFSGGATVTAGTVLMGAAAALTTGTVTVNGGSLDLGGQNPAFTILNGSGGTVTNSGANATLTLSAGTYAGSIKDGAGQISLLKTTTGTLNLAGSNFYSGTTNVSAGTLQLGSSTGSSPNSALLLASAGTFDLNGNIGTVASITGTGTVTNSSGSPGTLNIKTAGSNTFAGVIKDGAGQTSVIVSGTGTQVLSGTNNYSGGTTVSSGRLGAYVPTALGSGTVQLNGGILSLGGTVTTSTNATTMGSANLSSGVLQLTSGLDSQSGSAFLNSQVPVSDTAGFTASFVYKSLPGSDGQSADGTAFVLQNDSRGASAIGSNGSTLAYGGGTGIAITPSAAIFLNTYSPGGGQTNFDTDGNLNIGSNTSLPGIETSVGSGFNYSTATLTGGGVVLASGDPITVNLSYNGAAQTLTETLADPDTGGTFAISYTSVDLASILGGSAGGTQSAYIGFTGASGGETSTQTVSNFLFQSGSTAASFNGTASYQNNVVALSGTHSGIELVSNVGQNPVQIGTLTLQNNSSVVVTSVNPAGVSYQTLIVAGLSISGATGAWTGRLDLENNSLDVRSGSIGDITNQVAQGYAHGSWQGSGGITSSAAAANSSHLTALGVIVNDNGSGTPLFGAGGSIAPSFGGAAPFDGDILVKYTYYGDANLDGVVDGSDYSRIDNGAMQNLTGWYNGDFNYDGVINGSDYTLIDNAFNTQGASLASEIGSPTALVTAQIASPSGTSAVPEPASIGLCGLLAAGMLSRRRRRA